MDPILHLSNNSKMFNRSLLIINYTYQLYEYNNRIYESILICLLINMFFLIHSPKYLRILLIPISVPFCVIQRYKNIVMSSKLILYNLNYMCMYIFILNGYIHLKDRDKRDIYVPLLIYAFLHNIAFYYRV